MTTTHNFQPGDRVRATSAVPDIAGWQGTVRPSDETGYVCVRFDNDDQGPFANGRNYRRWKGRYIKNIEPVPVTVGTWVRVTGEFPAEINTDKIGEIFEVEQVVENCATHIDDDGYPASWSLKHLRVIEAPAADDGDLPETDISFISGVLRVRSTTPNERHTATLAQIEKLAEFITSEIPGEPSQSEGAIDTAIRIMRRQEAALVSVCDILRKRGPFPSDTFKALDAWLSEYDPAPPTFKRGDLVTYGRGIHDARIVTIHPDHTQAEVMHSNGTFVNVDVANLRHVKP